MTRSARITLAVGVIALLTVGVAAFLAGRSSASAETTPAIAPARDRAASQPEVGTTRVRIPDEVAAARPAAGVVGPIDGARDAYAFLRDLRSVEADPRQVLARQREVMAAWTGARVRWDVLVIDALCRTPDACHVYAFDRARTGEGMTPGFLPELRLEPTEHAHLREGCATHTPCVATLEATAEEVIIRDDVPTRIALNQVHITATRSVATTEQWFASN